MTRSVSLAVAALAVLLSGCASIAVVPVPIVVPLPIAGAASPTPDPDVQAFAKTVLNDLQPASIQQQREFCGYIFREATGHLRSAAPRTGTVDACDYGRAPITAIASYHTHGNHLAAYDSEIPSVDDAQASVDTGLGDYLATPGGRLWWIGADGISVQLCGAGCMVADATYAPDPLLPVDSTYSLRELRTLKN